MKKNKKFVPGDIVLFNNQYVINNKGYKYKVIRYEKFVKKDVNWDNFYKFYDSSPGFRYNYHSPLITYDWLPKYYVSYIKYQKVKKKNQRNVNTEYLKKVKRLDNIYKKRVESCINSHVWIIQLFDNNEDEYNWYCSGAPTTFEVHEDFLELTTDFMRLRKLERIFENEDKIEVN